MIRITGGRFGGRRIAVPPSGVRPSQDRLRQGVFSSLGQAVEDARVLDLFAGSGAYGLEAFSRGAASVCWVERHPRTCAVLERNVRDLAPEALHSGSRVIRADAMNAAAYAGRAPFDLVFADPPYAPGQKAGYLERLLRLLADAAVIGSGGVLVYEQPAGAPIISDPAWDLLRERRVGDSEWRLYRARLPSSGPPPDEAPPRPGDSTVGGPDASAILSQPGPL